MQNLFITGPYRSGSTLLEKILHNHKNIGVGSQPFPYLYFKAKTKFYTAKNLQKRYPIEHLFLERDYTLQEVYSFLENCLFSADEIARMFHGMTTYSGQYMPQFLQFCQQVAITPGTFYQVYKQLLSTLANYFNKDNLTYIGTKESFCEEFVPFFLAKQGKVIVTIRDPRDIVTSLNLGQGAKYAGGVRPVLYIIRQWRKSVSFCVQHDTHPNFILIKYEDLALNPWSVLDRLTQFLELPSFPREVFSQGILDQQGQIWQGNSSFNRYTSISSESIGKFRQILPDNCIRYIETICYPELRLLNYKFLYQTDGPDEEAIRNFEEPIKVTHEMFNADYSCDSRHIQEEIQRLKYLQNNLDEENQRLWFIFPSAYQTMKAILSTTDNVVE